MVFVTLTGDSCRVTENYIVFRCIYSEKSHFFSVEARQWEQTINQWLRCSLPLFQPVVHVSQVSKWSRWPNTVLVFLHRKTTTLLQKYRCPSLLWLWRNTRNGSTFIPSCCDAIRWKKIIKLSVKTMRCSLTTDAPKICSLELMASLTVVSHWAQRISDYINITIVRKLHRTMNFQLKSVWIQSLWSNCEMSTSPLIYSAWVRF